jgi:hypothetical protein
MSWFDYTPLGFVTNQVAKAFSDTNTLPAAQTGMVATESQNDDIDAITRYMADAQIEAKAYPEAVKTIADYSTWLSQLGWYTKHFEAARALSEAKYYRDRLNTILGRKLPEDWASADAVGAMVTPAVTKDPTPVAPLIPTAYKIAGTAAIAVTLTLVVLKKTKVI